MWSREESIAFLNKRTSQSDDTAAGNLAKTLGYLPLALEQAAAYCHITKKSYADYLDLFTTRRAELWKREKHPDNYRDTVATTWSLAFQEIEKFPFAADMLNLCSIVALDAIPRTLIHRALDHHAANNREAPLIDTMQVDDAMEALTNYSLITLEEKQISIHRLVQTVARDRMLPEAKESYRIAAIKALVEQFPNEGDSNPACWSECAALMPHAETLANAVTGETATWIERNSLACFHFFLLVFYTFWVD